ncbi:uncharacterized protein QC763_710316 [Podospora pseudopauciseta]|uniref:Uncharacterized protein n=1 Tax=Podospora pseudopauciseta TaxID=2093780 RepID=A0ABR0H293_9PEZI|nr:hypothetical protein QC763_710316 [Podospora pseudopauciseta]
MERHKIGKVTPTRRLPTSSARVCGTLLPSTNTLCGLELEKKARETRASPEFLPPAKTRRSSTETSQDASAPAGPDFLGATGLAVCSGLGQPNPAPNPATLPVFRPIPATPHKRLDASGL